MLWTLGLIALGWLALVGIAMVWLARFHDRRE